MSLIATRRDWLGRARLGFLLRRARLGLGTLGSRCLRSLRGLLRGRGCLSLDFELFHPEGVLRLGILAIAVKTPPIAVVIPDNAAIKPLSVFEPKLLMTLYSLDLTRFAWVTLGHTRSHQV